MPKQTIPISKHDQANAAYLKGEYEAAIKIQAEVVEDHFRKGKKAVSARKLLALYLYSNKDFFGAIDLLKNLEKECPGDAEIPENIGVMLRQTGRYDDAVAYLLKAHEMEPSKFNVCDGLAHTYHTLKNLAKVQEFGRMSLELKDAASAGKKSWPIPDGDPPAFDGSLPKSNVISFSLFGSNPRYLHGALRNARLASDLYPGWVCRFYCEPSVPEAIRQQLIGCGAEVVMRPRPANFYDGLIWRFEVMDDPQVGRFLVRDCDSVINIKERVAVDQWLESDKWFHMMRDFSSHTELILAGMWGGVSGVLPSSKELKRQFSPVTAATRTYDQHLLRDMVWPTMRQSVMIHDSVYTGCLGGVGFPEVGRLPQGRHVGQNEAAVIRPEDLERVSISSTKATGNQQFFIFGMPHSGIDLVRELLSQHSSVFCHANLELVSLLRLCKRGNDTYRKLLERSDSRAGLDRGRPDSDSETIQSELYKTWLGQWFDYSEGEHTHVGVCDHGVDANLAFHNRLFPDAKFVFVVRDPRDVAVSICRRKHGKEPGFDRNGREVDDLVVSVARDWSGKLKNVQRFNAAKSGRIELVRYEDLVSVKRRGAALKQLSKLLALPEKSDFVLEGEVEPVAEWEDGLSLAQVDALQKVAGSLMKILKYDLCEIDSDSLGSGGTVLPS